MIRLETSYLINHVFFQKKWDGFFLKKEELDIFSKKSKMYKYTPSPKSNKWKKIAFDQGVVVRYKNIAYDQGSIRWKLPVALGKMKMN